MVEAAKNCFQVVDAEAEAAKNLPLPDIEVGARASEAAGRASEAAGRASEAAG